jgi:hypothetical protein
LPLSAIVGTFCFDLVCVICCRIDRSNSLTAGRGSSQTAEHLSHDQKSHRFRHVYFIIVAVSEGLAPVRAADRAVRDSCGCYERPRRVEPGGQNVGLLQHATPPVWTSDFSESLQKK